MKNDYSHKKTPLIKKVWSFFTVYEKIWFFTLITAGLLLTFLLPDEETTTSVVLQICSILALVSGVLCELLISKQCKWNFIVSVIFVEITEIIICFILHYYASAIITIIFWIPIDIVSFVNWNKHKDKDDKNLTEVRKLTWKQDILIILAIAVFAVGVGFLLKLVGGEDTFIDALTSAFGIANGLFILFRFREQWFAWYLYTIFEGILWILSGQWVMLVLTVGYLINTTYGYIKWTKYINNVRQKNSGCDTMTIN